MEKSVIPLRVLSIRIPRYEGIACDPTSDAHKALVQATAEARGASNCKPYSVSGSLPLVKMMQKQGFDLQLDGFGLMSTYHGINEYCLLSDMRLGSEIMIRSMALLAENGYSNKAGVSWN